MTINRLKAAKSCVEKCKRKSQKAYTVLDLSKMNLTDGQLRILLGKFENDEISHITALNLSGNTRLVALPDCIKNMTSLSELNTSGTSVSAKRAWEEILSARFDK